MNNFILNALLTIKILFITVIAAIKDDYFSTTIWAEKKYDYSAYIYR